MFTSIASLALLACAAVANSAAIDALPRDVAPADGPLSTSGRWIVDQNGKRFKLRCVNWAGHMETNIPEGLQHQPIDHITSWIANNHFNCVRLTYSIDMALGPNTKVQDSFVGAAAAANVPVSATTALYQGVVQQNPAVANATVIEAFEAVIQSLNSKGVKVILDNHVSKAQWCCNQTDGNGWFGVPGANLDDSRYFDIPNWINGLKAVAGFAATQPNVIAMSLRNELRPLITDPEGGHDIWYKYIQQGAEAISSTNSELLIVVGGVMYAVDLSFIGSQMLDTSSFPNKLVWEFHWYSGTISINNCNLETSAIGSLSGYLLTQNKPYTAPLWLSEFGTDQGSPDTDYLSCLSNYMSGNDADWAVWALQGSYYIRQGNVEAEETWGLLDKNWNDSRNPNFSALLGKMWDQQQGP